MGEASSVRFRVGHADLERLCALNEFRLPERGVVFVGVRGALPVEGTATEWGETLELRSAAVDHLHPRCTVLQWKPAERRVAAFAGSTVPHRRYVEAARRRNGRGANQLMSGWFVDYRRGTHRAGTAGAHPAFRQTLPRPLRRTVNDHHYTAADRVEIACVGDNLHAAWCDGLDSEYYASAGCQVVVGRPLSGPWRRFHQEATREAQDVYPYLLIPGSELRELAAGGLAGAERVRFGSRGPRTRRVQEALRRRGFYRGAVDGDFGPQSLRALLQFQEPLDTGVCEAKTAAALGAAWP
ncbi:MAG: peptidoglycan-binding domain-containing protein [Armatimonadota bacterium]